MKNHVSVEIDALLYKRLESLSEVPNMETGELIRHAVDEYEERRIERRKLKKRFYEASFRIRRANEPVIEEWETTLADGLRED